MKCSARRKCQHCKEFYLPDRRNLRHQRYCSDFSGSQNSQRVKRVAKTQSRVLAQKEPSAPRTVTRSLHLCTTQVAQDEEVKRIEISDALQDVLAMQPAVMVGLISMMTGSALQEDIAATTRALLSKGQDILGRRLWSHNDAFSR